MAKDLNDKMKDNYEDMKDSAKKDWKDTKRNMRDAGKWTGEKIKKGSDKMTDKK